ncbi:MAG TPA: sugar phosphate nucleotidyltransferase [Chlamydiales bacterium]|nr:sugar phosphate nucleotidyltransferase [Chlamydiales bacterium]
MKAVILAGGEGSRLYPFTKVFSKHLLPIYNQPMICYSIELCLKAGVKKLLIIGKDQDVFHYKLLLNNKYPQISIEYAVQDMPKGIAEGIILSENFICNDRFIFLLGDNLFGDPCFVNHLKKAYKNNRGATLFSVSVDNPQEFGVLSMDDKNNVKQIIEKPSSFISSWIATGLYIYEADVIQKAKSLNPSSRGELEITDLNNLFIKNNELQVEFLEDSVGWFDLGSFESIKKAHHYLHKQNCFVSH